MTGVPALGVFLVTTAYRHDFTLVEEGIANADRLVEQAAGIVAQIEDIALQLVLADVLLEAVERGAQIVGRLLVELGDLNVADIVFLVGLHALDLDDLARERQLQRLLALLADDGELDLGLYVASHLVDRLVEGQALDLLAIDLGDDVPR